MTSPVDTSVKNFLWSQPNMPVINGLAGSLIAALDQMCQNGVDAGKSVTIAVLAGIATVTWAGTHAPVPDSVALIAGVTGGPVGFANLNGEQKVVAKNNATSYTFAAPLVANGNATGTITSGMAPLGATKIYSGVNLAAYQFTDAAGSGMVLRVDDTAGTFARVVAYESMTDINTGVNPYPSPAVIVGGGYWTKSQGANATGVLWSVNGDTRCFYLNIQSGSSISVANQITAPRFFGDAIAMRPGGDPFCAPLNYSMTAAIASQFDGSCAGAGVNNFAVPREYTGLGSAAVAPIYPFGTFAAANSGITALMGSFPSSVDGSLWLLQKYVWSLSALGPRGTLPGLYHGAQSGLWNTFKLGDRTPGTGLLAGRTLQACTAGDAVGLFTAASTVSNTGIVFFDVTGPWR